MQAAIAEGKEKEEQLSRLTSRLKDCHREADARAAGLEAAQAELCTHKEDLQKVSNNLEALRSEHSALEKRCQDAVAEASEARAAVEALESSKKDLVDEKEKAADLLVREGRRAEQLAEERNAAVSKANDLHKELTSKEREVSHRCT